MKYKVPTIIGSLSEAGTDFIEEKLQLEYKYYSGAYIVREFSLYCEYHPEYTEEHCIVTKQMVEEWLQSRPYLSTKTAEHKAAVIRHLALFMNRNGEKAYVLPERLSAITKNDFVPYIFTEQQLAKLFAAADEICPSNISPYRHLTMPPYGLFFINSAKKFLWSESAKKLPDFLYIAAILSVTLFRFQRYSSFAAAFLYPRKRSSVTPFTRNPDSLGLKFGTVCISRSTALQYDVFIKSNSNSSPFRNLLHIPRQCPRPVHQRKLY